MAKKNQEYSTRRIGPKFSAKRQAKLMEPFKPRIWIDGDKMYATCERMERSSSILIDPKAKLTFENQLWRALRADWNILAQTLTLTYLHGCVQINFGDDEEFVMAKISHGI
jgi:hypothetical protein